MNIYTYFKMRWSTVVKKTTLQIIGENTEKYFREKKYQSLSEFSRNVGLDAWRMKQIFKGDYKLYVEKVEMIAEELGVSVIDLVEDWSEEWCIIFEWVDSLLSIKSEIEDIKIAIQINSKELRRWSNYSDGDDGNLAKQQTFLTALRKQDELKEVIFKLNQRLEEKEKHKQEILELVEKFNGLDQKILKLKYEDDMTLEAISDKLGYSYQYIKSKHAEIMKIIAFNKKV